MPDLKTPQGRARRFADCLFGAPRSAGFQPAVSQACSLRGSDKLCCLGFGWGHAEWNSAIQQTGSLRYSYRAGVGSGARSDIPTAALQMAHSSFAP